jgi:hypothetical protein
MYKIVFTRLLGISLFLVAFSQNIFAQYIRNDATGQVTDLNGNDINSSVRPVQTAVPFLGITPNARAAGMGDQGVATSADENSAYWNPGKLAKVEKDYGFGVSVNPWLKNLVSDMWLFYGSFYYRLRKVDVISVNFTYFNLGTIDFTDINGNSLGKFNPSEFSLAGTYSRILSKKFSAGVTLKYINSNLSGDISNSANAGVGIGQTGAADVGFYYNTAFFAAEKDMHLAIGAMVSNIGGKLSYGNNNRADFIPTTLRLGVMHTTELDEYNKISFGVEASKLLTPSTTITYTPDPNKPGQSIGTVTTPQKTILAGMFGSFNDAPGGASEEFKEVMLSFAAEYWYDNMFAIRGGYFYENQYKGNRNYLSMGLGLKYRTIGIDLAYLVPIAKNNPLANTVRFTLSFHFDKPKKDIEQEAIIE